MSQEMVGIFVDWQNLYNDIRTALKKCAPPPIFNPNDTVQLSYLFHSFLLPEEKLFRIYLYTALPMASEEVERYVNTTPRFSSQREMFRKYWESPAVDGRSPKERQDLTHREAGKFQERLMRSNCYALRLGQQRCQNLEANGRPNLVQKQVDMLIGIDISHASFYRQVDKVMIFSKDTDIAPALKVARIHGLQTIVATIDSVDYPDIRLQKHADYRRSLDLSQIAAEGLEHGWDSTKIDRKGNDFR